MRFVTKSVITDVTFAHDDVVVDTQYYSIGIRRLMQEEYAWLVTPSLPTFDKELVTYTDAQMRQFILDGRFRSAGTHSELTASAQVV